jgi:uncharacterized OsmC-like protein
LEKYELEGLAMSTATQLFKVSSSGKWEGGLKTAINVREFSPIIMDEPQALGGTDDGPNPMEYVIAALSGCTSVMISIIAQEKQFAFQGVAFENTGILDLRGLMGVEGVSPHFQKVRFTVTIDTQENEERIEELKNEVERRCPVYNLLKDAKVELDTKWIRKQ